MVGRALAVNRNTVPPSVEQIRQRAYELYVEGGRQAGKDIEHWLQAEAEFTMRKADDYSYKEKSEPDLGPGHVA